MEQLYLAAEDACDILNLYLRPPENYARRRISSLTNTIEHVLDRHDRQWPIQSGWTRQLTELRHNYHKNKLWC